MIRGIIITEVIWLMAFSKVLGQSPAGPARPAICVMKEKKADCASHYQGDPLKKPSVAEVQLPTGTNYNQVESLDVSNNKFVNITFEKFTQLVLLYMKNLDFEIPNGFPIKKWFVKLKLLDELDMSGTHFGTNELDLIWPKKLSKLTLANMKFKLNEVYGLELLDSLEELDLNGNSLKYLPRLNESAQMKVINLNENPIIKLTVEQIAPYCELHSFTMQIKGDQALSESKGEYVLSSPVKYQQCIMVDEWFTKYFPKMDTGLTCQAPPELAHAPRNINFSAHVMKLRNNCLAKSPATTVFELLLYAVFFSILFPILYFGNEAYNRYQSRKLAAPATPVKHHRRRTTTTSSPDLDVEATPSEDGFYPESEESEM